MDLSFYMKSKSTLMLETNESNPHTSLPGRDVPDENPDAIANRLINRAEYRDGLQEMAIGVMILTFAGLMFAPVVFKSFIYKSFFWGGLLLIPIGYGLQWAIKKVRKQYLIGKVGYVKLKPVNRKRVGITLVRAVGLAFVVAGIVTFVGVKAVIATHSGGANWGLFPPLNWLIVGTGIFGGAMMVFRVRLLRYVVGGVIMAAMGVLLAFSGVSLNVGLAILYGFAGLLPFISGCIVFLLFIRQHDEAGA
jgi:hypothetical protein